MQIMWWLIYVIVISVASQNVTERSDVIRNCPSALFESGDEWRFDKQNVSIHLNGSNAILGNFENCSIAEDKSLGTKAKTIRVVLQAEDSVSLKFDELGNCSSYVTVRSHANSKYDANATLLISSNDSQSVVLDTEDMLTHGNQLISVCVHSEVENSSWTWHLNITVRRQECRKAKDSMPCSQTGYCSSNKKKDVYTCSCCPGFVGKYCEERDACYGNPCQHGGFCVDIVEGLTGNTYQCLCPQGFRGRSCEDEVSICDRKPCRNDGSCHGNQTHYSCLCPRGFTGKDCEVNVNECHSNPCIHGVCEDGVGKFKCYCLPGYGGDHCEFEYDECDSSPCINSGACEDLVAGYRCHCGPGYKGGRCQIKVDLCTPNPCPSPAQCVDRGNNYSCICRPRHNAPGCTQHFDPCYPVPCQHGGSCWPSLDSFFCSCPAGYTGDLCEEALFPSKPLPRRVGAKEGSTEERTTSTDPGFEPVDHWHNLYIAGTMLSFAATLVVLGAVMCHCRTHKTYLMFSSRLSGRGTSEDKQQKTDEAGKFSLNLHGNVIDGRTVETSGYEASNVDVIESLDAPLII